jgi:hypothetical protein
MSSTVRDIDPVVRALLTAMFGIVVHFGTVWTMEDSILLKFYSPSSSSSSCISDDEDMIASSPSPSLLLQTLFLHEYWVYLQHMNVLANPLLQHLDRRYGIALLKSKKHWVIAGTLSAYWTRESLGMFLCLPYLMMPPSSSSSLSASSTIISSSSMMHGANNFSMTHYLILYSLLYHTYKSRGVRKDASRLASSPLGIMTLVIDEFYVHDVYEVVLSVFRLLLQGTDTFIHYCIVRDLLIVFSSFSTLLHDVENEICSKGSTTGLGGMMVMRMHILFVIWVIHAALNQLFRCSTASIMVMWWQSLTKTRGTMKATTDTPTKDEDENRDVGGTEDEGAPDRTMSASSSNCSGLSITSSGDDIDENNADDSARRSSTCSDSGSSRGSEVCKLGTRDYEREHEFIVRRLLLSRENIANVDEASGTTERDKRMPSSSTAVDGAVRLSIAIAALSAFFMLGLGQVPLRALPSLVTTNSIRNIVAHDNSLGKSWLFVIIGFVRDHRQMLIYLAMHSWLLWSLLHAIWAMFIKPQKPSPLQPTGSIIRTRSIIQIIDLAVMLGVASNATVLPSNDDGIDMRRNSILLICVLLTFKAYAHSMRHPKIVRASLGVVEFVSKLAVLRAVSSSASFGIMTEVSSTVLAITWVVSVLVAGTSSDASTYLERGGTTHDDNDRVDVVFLGHPAFLSDSWALWLLPYSLQDRWQAPFWAAPLWPLHYLVGWYVCNWGHMDYFLGDDNRYGPFRMQNWVAPHFGRHFVTHPHQVRKNIEVCARHAERTRVRVLCLGALNKAEVRM